MAVKYKVAVLGIGGVGGYIGGKLAQQYAGSAEAEIYFIARGKNKEAITENGLKMVTAVGENIVRPDAVTSIPAELGQLDLVICCVKAYSLVEAIEQLRPCIKKGTVILPLLNGVDAAERIKKLLPVAEVWNGCIYIISGLKSPGVVEIGKLIPEIFFGGPVTSVKMLKFVYGLFINAGFNAILSGKAEQKVWEKFIFLSPIATLTSYSDLCIGDILKDSRLRNELVSLVNEAAAVAEAKKIKLPSNTINKTIQKIESLPYENTSSMHKDFKKGNETELDSLTLNVVMMGKEVNVDTPEYEKLYKELKSRK
jgi:2-dehydropantoate 2-reductase